MKKYLATCFSLLLVATYPALYAQDMSLYKKLVFQDNGKAMPYRMLAPRTIRPGVKYPLVIVLHGSGEKGDDNEKQLSHGADLFLADSNRERYPAFIVFPQCPESSDWSDLNTDSTDKQGKTVFVFKKDAPPTSAMRTLMDLERNLEANYPVNKQKIYVGGLSLGGMGTFEITGRMPHTFAAAFPMCGAENPATAPNLRYTSWWIFAGLKDDVVNPMYSELMYEAIKKAGGHAKASFYADANHNCWDSAFSEPDLLPWLFSKHL